jgi:type I restriction enzyme R subunit
MSPKLNEKVFEEHFCHQLEVCGHYKGYIDSKITVDKDLCLHFDDLERFWSDTQQERLAELKAQLGAQWREEVKKKLREELQTKRLFEVLKGELELQGIALKMAYFKPQTTHNPELGEKYKKNVFSYIRQYHFTSALNARQKADDRQSFDIALCLNGFVIVTIELKNQGTSGNYEEAIRQYLKRDLMLPIFQYPFLHIVCDNETVKMAASFSRPPHKDDFRDFNRSLVNISPNEKEYPVHYLYHEILLPESLLNFIETFLYPGKEHGWIFPRYHQQRSVRRIADDVQQTFASTRKLNLRYLVYHSAGSGKSNTIVWLAQNLRRLHVNNEKVFSSVIVLTHRLNLDDQISKDFMKAIDQMGIAAYARTTAELKKALEDNRQVIVSIIHKFSHLKEIADQTGKRVCLIIDEAHTGQEGALHENAVGRFDGNNEQPKNVPAGASTEALDEQEEFVNEIGRKVFPNMAFIALTATPSDHTLQHFGRKQNGKWEAFDKYTMDEAIAEGYIMDVVKNVISYETLYELDYQYRGGKEYPQLQVYRALKLKAFEDDQVIKEKCRIISEIFKEHTAHKIGGKAKAMIVAPSRLAAVKYKLFLDELLRTKNLPWKTLAAFSGTIEYNGQLYTESSMNEPLNKLRLKTEELFGNSDDIRFLVVANKFQVGFSESLLHTMFLDKPVRDRNAVQTLSRLNRMHSGKEDTLTVDFTDSYDEIIKAFRKYQNDISSHKEANPKDLFTLKDELLKKAVFTEEDVEECIRLFESPQASDGAALVALLIKLKNISEAKLEGDTHRQFRTLLARYVSLYGYIKTLFRIPQKEIHDFAVFATLLWQRTDRSMSAEELQEEIDKVKLKAYDISKLKLPEVHDGGDDGGGEGGGNVNYVKPMATVEEVVRAINLKFKEKVSPQGAAVVEEFMQAVTNDEALKTTIRNNLSNDERTVYETIVKMTMERLFTEYIINNSPENYEELTQESIMPFISQSAYKMLREMVKRL